MSVALFDRVYHTVASTLLYSVLNHVETNSATLPDGSLPTINDEQVSDAEGVRRSEKILFHLLLTCVSHLLLPQVEKLMPRRFAGDVNETASKVQ